MGSANRAPRGREEAVQPEGVDRLRPGEDHDRQVQGQEGEGSGR